MVAPIDISFTTEGGQSPLTPPQCGELAATLKPPEGGGSPLRLGLGGERPHHSVSCGVGQGRVVTV